MLAEQRMDRIRQKLNQDGAVNSASLSQEFGVSDETVRRDLLALEKEGVLRRVHGGAVSVITPMKSFYGLPLRDRDAVEQKRALAKTAASFVEEGDVISIGGGSTAKYFADALLQQVSSLTVVTYSLDVFDTLHGQKQMEVVLCGGQYHPQERSFYGDLAQSVLNQIHTRKCFEFPSGISLEHGIADSQPDILPLQKQMIAHAGRTFILADHSKYEKRALFHIVPMHTEFIYVTDSGIPDSLLQLYRENGYTIRTGDSI